MHRNEASILDSSTLADFPFYQSAQTSLQKAGPALSGRRRRAVRRWPPPPPKLHVRVSRMQLSRRHMIGDVRKSKHQVDLSYIRQVEAGFQYPRTMMYGFFAKRTDPPSSSLLFWLPASSFLPSPATFPGPLWPPIARSRDFHHASGTIWQSDYGPSFTPHFAFAYRSAYSGVTQRLCQFS